MGTCLPPGPGVCLVGRRMHVAVLYPAPSRKSQCSSVCPVATGSPFLSSIFFSVDIPCNGLGASLQWVGGVSYESGAVGRRAHAELTSALFDLVPVFHFIFQRYSWLLGHRAFQERFRESYR